MIEREFIRDKIKQMNIRDTINKAVRKGAGIGSIGIEKTPMGEKITVNVVHPGMVIGRGGATIKTLTGDLKKTFKLENPQIETAEIIDPSLNASAIAKRIASELERFGPSRFKGIGYRELQKILKSGALGTEIIIKGKIPGKRSKTWRFYGGYMKKRGNISDEYLDRGEEIAILRPGSVGINVVIMHVGTPLPDKFEISKPAVEEVKPEEVPVEAPKEEKLVEEKKQVKKVVAKKPAKKVVKKATKKSESKVKPKKTVKKASPKKVVAKKPAKKVVKKETKK